MQRKKRSAVRAALAGLSMLAFTAAGFVATPGANAQEFPVQGRPITMLVGLGAGGGVDLIARLVADGMQKQLGTPVQVVNKPGASHQVAMTELARSKPDGYTIGVVTFMTMLVTYLDKSRGAIYDRSSFQPIANMDREKNVLVVNSNSPYKTIDDLVAAGKKDPQKIIAATSGINTNTHLSALMLEQVSGAKFAYVHFASAAEALAAVLGGNADFFVSSAAAARQHLDAGTLRGLGIADSTRNSFLPDIPTLGEQGYDVVVPFSNGLAGPAGMPPEVVAKLEAAVHDTMETPEVKEKMAKMFFTPEYQGADDFGATWADLEKRVQPLLKLAAEGAQ
jgi:tripartite-type tricarboxylate transporter receptor subunit TctC